jgi:hypothetical protein
MLALDLTKRCGDGVVEARMLESLQQKPLENIDAPFGRVRAQLPRDEIVKGCDPVECNTTIDDRMRGNTAEEERDAWTQSDADQHARRGEASLVGPDQRTPQEPLGRLILLQLDGNRGAAVRHDAEHCVAFGRDNPEASDKGAQRLGGLVETDLRPFDEGAADAHLLPFQRLRREPTRSMRETHEAPNDVDRLSVGSSGALRELHNHS